MSLFSPLKKIFTKPDIAPPVKSERQKEIELRINRASEGFSELDEHHTFIVANQSSPDPYGEIELIYGDNWQQMYTLGQAIRYVDRWLEHNNLDIGQEPSNLLTENRRNPFSEYARKSSAAKGNWHRYGRCPFVDGQRYTYSRVILHIWLEESVRPQAKPDPKAA